MDSSTLTQPAPNAASPMAPPGMAPGAAAAAQPIVPSSGPSPQPTQQTASATIPAKPASPAPTVQQPIHPQVAKNAALGAAARFLLGGPNYTYSVDPNTGKSVATPAPQKPGQMFRSLLAGALLGGASAQAEHNQNPQSGFGAGLVTGAGAAVRNRQVQDQQARAKAEEEFKNQQELTRDQREQKMVNAQIANMESETASRQQHNDLLSQEATDKHNAAVAALKGALTNDQVGGKVVPLTIGGEQLSTIPANDLAAAYTKDPSVRKAPDGYVRHFLDTTDNSEAEWNGLHWVDASGHPINMTDKTNFQVVDVPVNAMTTKVPTSGKDINAISGTHMVEDGKTYQMSPLDMDALNTRRLKDAREQAVTDLDKKRVALDGMRLNLESRRLSQESVSMDKAQWQAADQQLSEQIKTYMETLKDPLIDPDTKKLAQQQVKEANDQLKAVREKLFPGTKIASETTNAPATGEIPAGAVTATNPATGQKSYSTDGGKTWNLVTGATQAPPKPTAPSPAVQAAKTAIMGFLNPGGGHDLFSSDVHEAAKKVKDNLSKANQAANKATDALSNSPKVKIFSKDVEDAIQLVKNELNIK